MRRDSFIGPGDHVTTGVISAITSVPAGNTIANTTAETAYETQPPIPAGSLAVGDVIFLRLGGVYSVAAVAPSVTGRVKIGAVEILNTGSLTALSSLTTDRAWWAEIWITVCAVGVSGKIEAMGKVEFTTPTNLAVGTALSSNGQITVDTTIENLLITSIQFSLASASNSITLRQTSFDVRHARSVWRAGLRM